MVALGYLVGSVASAIVVCRIMGLPDPREGGSGNPGATNVLRLGGKKAAALTFAGDLLKGVIPVVIARILSDSDVVIAATGVAAFLGHLFPIFFRFQGGKGVATAFGVAAGVSPSLAITMAGIWLLTAALTRYSSLAALIACACAPLLAFFLSLPLAVIVAFVLIALLIFWRHRANIERLRSGTESRIGTSKK